MRTESRKCSTAGSRERIRHTGITTLALILQLAGCSEQGVLRPEVEGPAAAQPGDLLSEARIDALGGANTQQWRTYIQTSRRLAQMDADTITAELRRTGQATWHPAAVATDFHITHDLNAPWFGSEQGRITADNTLTFQTPSGGWSKTIGFSQPRSAGESFSSTSTWSWIGTFDNGATMEELWLLAGVARTHNDSKYQNSFLRGLTYIFTAQMPNGCWPQVFPLAGSYHDAATFNDAATPNIIALLSAVSSGAMAFVPATTRAQASESIQRGRACIVSAQTPAAGELTVWGQQHDPLTLVPVQGRAYEPAALTSLESAPLMDVLMAISNPDAREIAAVHAAARWLSKTAIYGWRYVNGALESAPGAGPLWARFYEIGTNRPVFSDRDGVVRYDLTTVSEERRLNYAWYTTAPAATMQRYATWSTAGPGSSLELTQTDAVGRQ